MPALPQGHLFPNVAVGIPSKISASEAEEEWQEVHWVSWVTGDVSVDADSYLLVFRPLGSTDALRAKPLGNLIRASTVTQEEERTLVVITSDSLNRTYRFTFESAKHVSDFLALAAAAESQKTATAGLAVPISSDSGSGLEAELYEMLSSQLPLVYGGVELHGPDPGGDTDSQVLLGRGALVLLDQPDDEANRAGSYELLFYSEDEGIHGPAKRFTICPTMALRPHANADGEGGDGPASMFELPAACGVPPHMISFDSASVGATFLRDYRVRQRLMELAAKTVKGMRAASDLRGQIRGMQRMSLAARSMRFLLFLVIMFLVGAAARLIVLCVEDPSRTPQAYMEALARDVSSVRRMSQSAAMTTTAKACQLAVGAVPAVEVSLCAAQESASQMKRCIQGLLGV
mmetsp:Transcript_15334/g.42040  ORF Transcript_15334/g.42040 Transcript_15334/m.42040 type:complete len:403 (-) Transcript_15334:84-1292(-)